MGLVVDSVFCIWLEMSALGGEGQGSWNPQGCWIPISLLDHVFRMAGYPLVLWILTCDMVEDHIRMFQGDATKEGDSSSNTVRD